LSTIERETAGTYRAAGFAADGTDPVELIISRRNFDGLFNAQFNGKVAFAFSIDKDVQRVCTSAMQYDGSMLIGLEGFGVGTNEDWFDFEDEAVNEKIGYIVRFVPTCITAVEILPFDNVCEGEELTLAVNGSFTSYIWSNGTNTSSNAVTLSCTHTLSVLSDEGCTGSASVEVEFNPIPSTPFITQSGNVLTASGGEDFSWTFNNNPISDNFTNNLPITELGNYIVVITDENGCTSNAGNILINVISTNDVEQFSPLIYPNPAHNVVILKLSCVEMYMITIAEISGKNVYTIQRAESSVQIDISTLECGLYQITAISSTKNLQYGFMKSIH